MRLLLLCLAAVASLAAAASGGRKNPKVAKAFKSFGYLPELIPNELLNVYYPTVEVCLGDVIAQTRTMVSPVIAYDFKPGVNYTLIIFDPDTPSARAPKLRSYLVLLQVNIFVKGKSGYQVGNTIATYIPPTPYPGSGYHRYTALLYEQSGAIDLNKLARSRYAIRRYRFNVAAFAAEYRLGSPVAGNFFRSRVQAISDEYYCYNCNTCPAPQTNALY